MTVVLSAIFDKHPFSISQIIGSYLLLNEPSIGYVWIMRVFLLMAIITPPIWLLCNKVGYKGTIALLIGLFALSFCIDSFLLPVIQNNILRTILSLYIPYITGYSTLAILAFLVKHRPIQQNFALGVILLTLFIISLAGDDWIFDPKVSKYPPYGLYLAYGLLCSFALWYIKPLLVPLSKNKFVAFVSKNSMWLYLWHIIPVYLIGYMPYPIMANSFIARYIFVMVITFALFKIWSAAQRLVLRKDI